MPIKPLTLIEKTASKKEASTPVKSVEAAKKFADLKDTYLNLLQEGYKPEDVEKFIKEVQTNPNAEAPQPKPGTKPLTTQTTSIGSAKKEASDADNFMGKVNEGCKTNPKANEDLVSLKVNKFDKKTCKGSFSAALKYLEDK